MRSTPRPSATLTFATQRPVKPRTGVLVAGAAAVVTTRVVPVVGLMGSPGAVIGPVAPGPALVVCGPALVVAPLGPALVAGGPALVAGGLGDDEVSPARKPDSKGLACRSGPPTYKHPHGMTESRLAESLDIPVL